MDIKNGKKLGLYTTIAFVIANMVGTGVFTSLGFQLLDISNTVSIMLLWLIGGVIALCGSLVYGELGAAMPRSGGEYYYLSKIFHPLIGFLSGWVSITVGFAAPVAAASMVLGGYTSEIFGTMSPQLIATLVIVIITLIHSFNIRFGGNFQNLFTFFKVALILVFVVCGLTLTNNPQNLSADLHSFSMKDIINPAFPVLIIWVSYAFSGWNASAYIAGEIKSPQKTIPRSLFISTIIVTVLYLLLNFTFLYSSPKLEMAGIKEVGLVSAIHIFGLEGGKIMGILVSVLLISSISSMVFVGPRVSQVMGEDLKILKFLSIKSKNQIPVYAILLQSCISILFILTSTFESVIIYAGFTLSFFTFLTVIGLFVHRNKFKTVERPYKTWGYPYVPIIFLGIMLWVMYFTLTRKPLESILGLGTVFSGSVIYFINKKYEQNLSKNDTKNT
jgi:APA family basic amino acid/polyamine antiporter